MIQYAKTAGISTATYDNLSKSMTKSPKLNGPGTSTLNPGTPADAKNGPGTSTLNPGTPTDAKNAGRERPSAGALLVVDDEEANRLAVARIFEREGFEVYSAPSGKKALEVCRKRNIHVVLSDLMMPGMTGIELIDALKTVSPATEVVMMTAHGTVETAVEAMRQGAYDFVEKPLKRAQIVKTVRKAGERHQLVAENRSLRSELSQVRGPRNIIGSSAVLRKALEVAKQAGPSNASVLISGESGTGKELLARFIHEVSGRPNFVGVNLSALPESVIESELFGHEKGSFTGAVGQRIGRIAQAHGGTLFLDEIGELSHAVQVKLLRVLQEGEYEPVGGKTRKANFRLIVATHRDLRAAVDAGTFREDLFYRINVIPLTAPSLRDRSEDIPLLVEHFVTKYCNENNKPMLNVADDAMAALRNYAWRGNVRELENAVERAVVLNRSGRICRADLPQEIIDAKPVDDVLRYRIGMPLEEIERSVIEKTLDHTGGDKQKAAQLLGISARTIYRKIDREDDLD